jgi:hypothetical protein
MGRFRRHARLAAAALLVSFATLGVPHSFDPYHDWNRGPIPHDESAHSLAAQDSGQTSHPLHCLACHWARSFKPRTVAAYMPAHQPRGAKYVQAETRVASSSHSAVQPPLRAPPTVRDVVL